MQLAKIMHVLIHEMQHENVQLLVLILYPVPTPFYLMPFLLYHAKYHILVDVVFLIVAI